MSNYFDAKAKKEERTIVCDKIKAITDAWETEKRPGTNEEMKLFDEYMADKNKLTAEIESAERVENFKTSLSDKSTKNNIVPFVHVANDGNKPSKKEMNQAFCAWALNQAREEIPSAFRASADRCEVNIHANRISLDSNPITTPDYAVNAFYIEAVELARDPWNQLRQAVDVVTTDRGGKLPWVYINDTGVRASAVDKVLGGYSNTGFTVQEKACEDYLITTGVFPVPQPWLNDSGMQAQIYNLLGKRLGRSEAYLCGSTGRGSGSKEPLALTTQITPTLYYSSVSAVAYYDVLQALQGEVGIYAEAPGAGYLMAPEKWNDILRTIDAIGRPIFVDTVQTQGQKQVLSKPVYLVPNLGDNIFFGDLKEIKLRQVGGIEIFVDPYTKRIDDNAIQFGANERLDIMLIDPLAVKCASSNTGSFVNCGEYTTIS